MLLASLWVACSAPPGARPAPTATSDLPRRLDDARFSAAAVQGLAADRGVAAYAGRWPTDGLPGADERRVHVPADGAPARGAAEPLVTIVVFSDFECPFCSRLNPTLGRLLESHPDDVRVVFRQFPLPMHRHAEDAAEAALEAFAQRGDAGFWEMHDLIFANQRALERPDLERYAQGAGLDVHRFARALDEGAYEAAVDADVAMGRQAGVRGTPAFFLNGRVLVGAQPFELVDAVVREEIALARAAMDAGVPRHHLYAAAMAAVSRTAAVDRARAAPREPPRPEPPRRPERREPPEDTVYHVPIEGSPARGPRTALVTIVELGDVECPFCERVQGTLSELRERYGSDLRIVWKHNPLPFHSNALPAAMALEEARAQRGERAFWRMHDLLFENRSELDREHLEEYARAVGLNVRRFRRALDEERHRDVIERDVALARRLGATGTPTFFVNGVKLRGAQPLERFVERVDERLADARARLARGTRRQDLYEAVIADGLADVESWREGQRRPVAISVPEGAPWRGARDGVVTIQVFSDFECPFCARVRPTVERLLDEYPSQVRLVWRNLPLPMHDHAELAAEAAMEVYAQGGNDAFWAFHDLLFDHQRALSPDDLEGYAEQLGALDMVRFREALRDHRHRGAIEADVEAARATGEGLGTPAFLIGGRVVQGAQPYEVFRDAVERALEPDGNADGG